MPGKMSLCKITLHLLTVCLAGLVTKSNGKVVGNVKDDDQKGTISVVDIQDDNKTQYLNQNFEQGNYNYGYDIKPSGPVGQFHHETKAPDNVVYGCYGYEAPNSQNQMTFYISDAWGYRPVRQEESTEVFYPSENPEGTTHMKGTLTRWADLVFPDMCAQFAERIASSSNVVTKTPIQVGTGGPIGTKFENPRQPNVVTPVTGIPKPFVHGNSPAPPGSFDVIHLNGPGGATSSSPSSVRFTVTDDTRTPGSPTSSTNQGLQNNFGTFTNRPSGILGIQTPSNPSGQISSSSFPPNRFSTPISSTGPHGQPSTATTIQNRPSPIPIESDHNPANTSPSFVSDTQLSNDGSLLPSTPAGPSHPNQNFLLNTNSPFTNSRLTITTPNPNNFNEVIRISSANPTNFNNLPGTSGSGQTFVGNSEIPSSFPPITSSGPSSGGRGPSGSSPKVTNNESRLTPTTKIPSIPTILNAVASATPARPHSGNRNPYQAEEDDSAERAPSNTGTFTSSQGIAPHAPFLGSNNPTSPGAPRLPGGVGSTRPAQINQGSSAATTPTLSNAQSSTTFLLPNRGQTNYQGTPGLSTPVGSNSLATQGTRRPTQTTVQAGTDRTSNINRQPSTTSGFSPSSGFSGAFNNPSTLQASSTIQQTAPNQFSQRPVVTPNLTPGEHDNRVIEGGTSTAFYNPTKGPETTDFGGNRFTSNVFSHSTPVVPVEPNTDNDQFQSSTPRTTQFNSPSIPNSNAQITNRIENQATREPSFGTPVVPTNNFGTRQPTISSTRTPTTFTTRAPTTTNSFQRPSAALTFNNSRPAGENPDEFCAKECSSCKAKEPIRDDEEFYQIPGAILANIPVIFYPDCSDNAYSRPAVVPFCPSQKTQCGDSQPLTMKFPDASNFLVKHDAPVARNAFVSRNNPQSNRVARKVRRGRQQTQQRILRS